MTNNVRNRMMVMGMVAVGAALWLASAGWAAETIAPTWTEANEPKFPPGSTMWFVNNVADMPIIYRTVVEMYDLEQRSVDDVARAVGRSPGAIFMLRSRAHRQLGALMGAASKFLSGAG